MTREEEERKKEANSSSKRTRPHKHAHLCHTRVVHTRTHTSAPSNNPLILFIISQLFLVRAIHERNHTHKHTPMCRAEIQYKYTHLYFLISASIFTPFFAFSLDAVLCISSAVTHHNPTSMPSLSEIGGFASCSLCLKSFSKPRSAHFLAPLIAF